MLKVLSFLVVLCYLLPALAYPNSNTALETLATFSNEDFKHDLLNPPSPNYWIVTPGGNVSYMNLSTNRVLAGNGVSLSLNILEPCGVILPHLHPRASKITYAITSQKLFVGFIQENGARTVFNNLTAGQGAFVPRGSIMFFQNLDCKPGMNLFAYNYEDPGLLSLLPQMMRMPDTVLGPAFGIGESEMEYIHRIIPGIPLSLNDDCRRRCGLPPLSSSTSSSTASSTSTSTSTPTPTPSSSSSSSSSSTSRTTATTGRTSSSTGRTSSTTGRTTGRPTTGRPTTRTNGYDAEVRDEEVEY